MLCSVLPCKAPLNHRRLILQLRRQCLSRSCYCLFWGLDGGEAWYYKPSPLEVFKFAVFFFPSEMRKAQKEGIRSSANMFEVFCCSSWNFNSSLKIGTVQPCCIRSTSCRHWNKCSWCRATWLILKKARSSGLQTINAPLSSLLRDLKLISLMPQLLTAFFSKKPPQGGEKWNFLTQCAAHRGADRHFWSHFLNLLVGCGQLLWF